MKDQHAKVLEALLSELTQARSLIAPPTEERSTEFSNGWHVLLFWNGKGLSIVCHDHSYNLETAQIVGTVDKWEFAKEAWDQVEGHRKVSEVVLDIMKMSVDSPLKIN
jgi:hypothetical protein